MIVVWQRRIRIHDEGFTTRVVWQVFVVRKSRFSLSSFATVVFLYLDDDDLDDGDDYDDDGRAEILLYLIWLHDRDVFE